MSLYMLVCPGYPDFHRRALYAVQHHGRLLSPLVRPLLPGLHGAHHCSLCLFSELVYLCIEGH